MPLGELRIAEGNFSAFDIGIKSAVKLLNFSRNRRMLLPFDQADRPVFRQAGSDTGRYELCECGRKLLYQVRSLGFSLVWKEPASIKFL